jgi:flagellar motility protein MotE (MotC chaperone)
MPRILPLVGIAVGGVLAINALAGARDLPDLISGAKAFAEEAAKPIGGDKTKGKKAAAKTAAGDAKAADPAATPAAPAIPGGQTAPQAATGDATNTAATAGLPPPTITPKPVCAPTAAELAKEAGLSPAELQVLQNLGARRGQLDQREADLSTQLALLAAAEAKIDVKTKVLQGLKTDVQGLLAQADGREAAETDRLVKVFEGMKPQDAADRLAIMDDSVRLPIGGKMKDRALSGIVAKMKPADAKKFTESLAHRFAAAQTLAQNATAKADEAAAATKVADDSAAKPAAKPVRTAAKKPARKKPRAAAATDDAAPEKTADKTAAKPAEKTAAADKPAPGPAAAPPAAKAG